MKGFEFGSFRRSTNAKESLAKTARALAAAVSLVTAFPDTPKAQVALTANPTRTEMQLGGGQTNSSERLYEVLRQDFDSQFIIPVDPNDAGRYLQALQADPSYRQRLTEMSTFVGPESFLDIPEPGLAAHPKFLQLHDAMSKYGEGTFAGSFVLNQEYRNGTLDVLATLILPLATLKNDYEIIRMYTLLTTTEKTDPGFINMFIRDVEDGTYREKWNVRSQSLDSHHSGDFFDYEYAYFQPEGDNSTNADRLVAEVLSWELSQNEGRYLYETYSKEQLGQLLTNVTVLQAEQAKSLSPVIADILKRIEPRVYKVTLLGMDRHEDTKERIKDLKKWDAKTIFYLLVHGGVDAWQSTVSIAYDGHGYRGPEKELTLVGRIKNEHKDAATFLKVINPSSKELGTFFELLRNHARLDSFFDLIGTHEQQVEVVSHFLLDLTNAQAPTERAITIRFVLDTFASVPRVRDALLLSVETEAKKYQQATSTETDEGRFGILYKLILTSYYLQHQDLTPTPWVQTAINEYRDHMPMLSGLSEMQLFPESVNVQYHYFYDDRRNDKGGLEPEDHWDGHNSFKNYIRSKGGIVSWNKYGKITKVIGGSSGWKIFDRAGYVALTKEDKASGRDILVCASKPDNDDATERAARATMRELCGPAQVIVHRGHSYHVNKTIAEVSPETTFMNVGSCGGARNISDILARSLTTHILSTSGTGSMLVNDRVIGAFDETILRTGKVDWVTFNDGLDAQFKTDDEKAQKYWKSYVMPHENATVQILAAYEQIIKGAQQKPILSTAALGE